MRVSVYVDGFNLYYGLRTKFGRTFHWLDLQALAARLLYADQRLEAVHYFTARVRNQTAGRHRQDTYLQALRAHCERNGTHATRVMFSGLRTKRKRPTSTWLSRS